MTALVWRGKCLRMRPVKGSFRGVACSPEAKPAPSGANGNTVDRYRLKPLQEAIVRPIRESAAESKRKSRIRNQRSFYDRQKAVELGQQALNAEFEKLASSLRMAPHSPHQMILDRMHAMNCKRPGGSTTLLTSPVGNKSH
jgi:hypothetical protein